MRNKETAVKLYRRGFNSRTISKRLGVSIAQVDTWLKSVRNKR